MLYFVSGKINSKLLSTSIEQMMDIHNKIIATGVWLLQLLLTNLSVASFHKTDYPTMYRYSKKVMRRIIKTKKISIVASETLQILSSNSKIAVKMHVKCSTKNKSNFLYENDGSVQT